MSIQFAAKAAPDARPPRIADSAVPEAVRQAVGKASRATGVDFSYLMAQAQAESSFDPDARARTSSATGLYQFIESTWLDTVDRHGERLGLAAEAAAITRDGTGRPVVADRAERQRILDLRRDPTAAALMAGAFASDNEAHLEGRLGREVGATELYFAHFLGAGGATRFLKALDRNPGASAAALFPKEAAANKGVFYAGGRPLSLAQVYERFDHKFAGAEGLYAGLAPTPSEAVDRAGAADRAGPAMLAAAGGPAGPVAEAKAAGAPPLELVPLSHFTTMVLNSLETPGEEAGRGGVTTDGGSGAEARDGLPRASLDMTA